MESMGKEMRQSYTYSDIGLVPREKSTIVKRSDVDPSTEFCGVKIGLPLIISPMKTVCGPEMCYTLAKAGHFSWIPRGYDFADDLKTYTPLLTDPDVRSEYIGAAIGATDSFLEHFEAFRKLGVKVFCIDVANGFHVVVERAVKTIQDSREYGDDVSIVTGCVAGGEGYRFLSELGVHGVRVGIGGGSVCKTSSVSSVGQGMVSALLEAKQERKYMRADGQRVATIIADGGCKEPGDLAKALASGADYVMAGSLFAGTKEAPGRTYKMGERKYKPYAGEASFFIQKVDRHVEGIDTMVPYKGSVHRQLFEYEEGLRSAMAYMNCGIVDKMKKIHEDSMVVLSNSARYERTTHIHDVR